MITLKRSALALSVGIIAVMSSACGDKQLIESVKVNSFALEGDTYLEAKTRVNLGAIGMEGMVLPVVDFPIPDFRDPDGAAFGRLGIENAGSGRSDVKLAVNASHIIETFGGDYAVDAVLPNGLSLPLVGVGELPIIAVEVPGTHGVRLYLALGEGTAVIGTAVPIKQLDGVGRTIAAGGPMKTFLSYVFPQGVEVSGGAFFSKAEGQNGIGIFTNLGSLLEDIGGAGLASGVASRDPIHVTSSLPSYSDMNKLRKEMNKLAKKKTKLELHD